MLIILLFFWLVLFLSMKTNLSFYGKTAAKQKLCHFGKVEGSC